MRIQLAALEGHDGKGPTFAQLYGLSFEEGLRWVDDALSLSEHGRKHEACTILEGLVTLNPRSATYWLALGVVYEELDLLDDACQAFEQASRHDPTRTEAWLRFGLLQLRRGISSGVDALRRAAQDVRPECSDFAAHARAILESARA